MVSRYAQPSNGISYGQLKYWYYYKDGNLYSILTNSPVESYIEERGKQKYYRTKINNKLYYLHRLIFWWMKGYLPDLVDHKDRNGLNNNIDNLRDLSHSLNHLNADVRSDNTSGHTGVRWNKKAKKWIARIYYQGKDHHLGCFDTIEEAIKAREDRNTTLFKEM